MIVAARAWWLSPFAHAVDGDVGALCGARPRDGRWLPSRRLPVNCPRCLIVMSRGRLAFCESPSPAGSERWHVRRLGMSGLRLDGGCDTRALCGALVAWDRRDEVTREAAAGGQVCLTCAQAAFPSPLASSNAVRF